MYTHVMKENILIKIIFIIAIVELMIMGLFTLLDHSFNDFQEMLLDTFLLVAFSAPLLYKFVINPFLKKEEVLKERVELSLIGSNDGIWDWDLLTNKVYYSPRWKEIIGYEDAEIKNEFPSWQSRVHPDDIEMVMKYVQENIDGKTEYYIGEHRLQHKDGRWVWILSRGKAIFKDGKPTRMTGTHTDITEQKEESLKHQERAEILENSLNEIYIFDKQSHKFLYLNKTALKNIEYSFDEISRMTPLDIAPEMTAEALSEIFSSLDDATLENISFSTIQQRKDKSLYNVDVFIQKTIYEGSSAYAAIVLDTTEKVKSQKNLIYQAQHDALTSLPNRILFNDRLEQAIEKAKRRKTKIGVLFLDLDHFKEINDSLGHDAGDIVLTTVTKRLQEVIRAEDTISRLGGDEFTIILEDLDNAKDASTASKKILEKLSESMMIHKQELYISSSIGISIYPDDGSEPQSLLKFADSAMYKAKAEGRNNFQYYDSKLTELAFERVVMETSLHIALKNNEFIVYYQPQVDAKENRVTGMEALVRWKHSSMGLISPIKFIPLAESMGLIVEIDRRVMKMAMGKIVEWNKDNERPVVMAINLSVKQLESQDCLSVLTSLLEETGCNPEWIELEVTESQIMSKPEEAIKKLRSISDLGIKLAVDDFGTGYSSLAYLKRLPIDKLKIDREFIKDLPGDEEDSGITKAIIALSKSLNLRVIAEGVETKEQKDFLLENGCDSIQGYFYSKPMPANEMDTFLHKMNKIT